jgi:hypothetical protein
MAKTKKNASRDASPMSSTEGALPALPTQVTVDLISPLRAAAGPAAAEFKVDCHLEATEPDRLSAIKQSACCLMAEMVRMRDQEGHRLAWQVQEIVWPALGLPDFKQASVQNVRLTLLPLDRIGQVEGFSGSQVLVGYFSATHSGAVFHSHPLVIKTLKNGASDKLREECENALSIKPFAYDKKDDFAIPIFFDDKQVGYKLLWAICSVTNPIKTVEPPLEAATRGIRVVDLRVPLKSENNEQIENVVHGVFELLTNFHRRFEMASRNEVSVDDQYNRYLRDMWEKKGDNWGERWTSVWGTRDKKLVPGAGDGAINPLWLVDQLKTMQYPMQLGATHGDLHPGNIILKEGRLPTIIDFGWARDKSHITKDFVLLECNFRFITLRTELQAEEVQTFANWICCDSTPPERLGEYLQGRAKLIQLLRSKAKNVFPKETDWDKEYIIPLFIVALGLLRFVSQYSNQHAALCFVRSSATYLTHKLNL